MREIEMRSARQRVVQDELRRRRLENRAMLPPQQLARLGEQLADMLLDDPADLEAQAVGLSERGLVLATLLAAGLALEQACAAAGDQAGAISVGARLARVAAAVHQAEIATVRREQEQMRQAVARALAEQHAEATRLTSLVQELSTPIVPIYDGILVLPLIGAIDSHRASAIMEQLLGGIATYHADSVIIDITGVAVVDTQVAQHLLQTARAAGLLGATAILVGISPEVAQTITQIGVTISGVPTLSNLQAGIMFALRKRGLAIRQIGG